LHSRKAGASGDRAPYEAPSDAVQQALVFPRESPAIPSRRTRRLKPTSASSSKSRH